MSMVPRSARVAAWLATLCLAASPVHAQSLTAEQLEALVDERVAAQNPFEELLNDPDPARSLAAMEIMLESGESSLVRMALEFGLLSTDPTVKRTALESYLRSKPVLSFRFDGSEIESSWFDSQMKGANATMTTERIGYWTMPVGEYDAENLCYKHTTHDTCFITVSPDGLLWRTTNGRVSGRFTIGEGGFLEGSTMLQNVNQPVPTTAQLLD